MPDIFNFNSQMKEYFNTLPAIVQETIKQTDIKLNDVNDLKICAENLMRGNKQDGR